MAVITKSDYGIIAINNKLISRLVVDELLPMQAMVSLCNKKGKIIKNKPTPFIEPDYYDAVEIDDSAAEGVSVRVYLTLRLNTNIKEITNKIFERIENSFEVFDLGKPKMITIMYKGIIAEHSSNKKLEVKREYNC